MDSDGVCDTLDDDKDGDQWLNSDEENCDPMPRIPNRFLTTWTATVHATMDTDTDGDGVSNADDISRITPWNGRIWMATVWGTTATKTMMGMVCWI